ncbi:CBS domain-containing protein [Aurantimonas sp. A3-2-R12]|uniref:CBS domain-containing protein n=1 Tax=Aurantimonas sp. A3-2-R12 TaxID=3114362 RepID=UPI002E19B7B6|nr:CBS domain-containing protein [Aurantimonas sp. A3-2-R12]
MATVRQLLDKKGSSVLSVGPDDTVFNAIQTMSDNNIGSLAVLEGNRLVGIVTERHYARNVFLKGRSSPKTSVKEIMTTHVVCARPEQSVEECMAIMTEKAVRHMPVLEDDRLIGIVSIGDLVKNIISDKEFVIDQLEHYITG